MNVQASPCVSATACASRVEGRSGYIEIRRIASVAVISAADFCPARMSRSSSAKIERSVVMAWSSDSSAVGRSSALARALGASSIAAFSPAGAACQSHDVHVPCGGWVRLASRT
jgi:hypothetical protein